MCEKCLYRNNCQFLATHKKAEVVGCDAFENESRLKAEVINEFVERLLSLKIKPEFPWDDFYVTESAINSVKKEMMEELEEKNNEK
jgi:regulator of RNase E activity RraB